MNAPPDPYPVRARQLLKNRAVWMIPVVVGSIFLVLMTLFYIGSVVNPVGHLRGLPVSIVNEDRGAVIGTRPINLGADVQAGLSGSRTVSRLLALSPQEFASAKARMNRNGAYATVVIPADFSASLLSLAGQPLPPGTSAGKPTIELLANRRAGAVGVQLAQGVLGPAIAQVSQNVGKQLLVSARPSPVAGTASAAVLASPITFETIDYRPLPSHSALGLSAFYVALLTLICGFLAATIINTTVDAATGYATTDIGPRWQQRTPLPINRWQTLLTKWAMALPITGLLTAVMLLVAVGLLGMDAPDVGYLWLFVWLAAVSVAAGTLVLFAVFGTQGQLLALLLFVYLGLASAGGTVPLQALPSPFKFVSQLEPLRQILDGTRSILYFNASGPAGLTRGIVTASAGLVFWLVIGMTVVRWYDRKGLHRIKPDLLAYVHSAVSAYDPEPQPRSDVDTDSPGESDPGVEGSAKPDTDITSPAES